MISSIAQVCCVNGVQKAQLKGVPTLIGFAYASIVFCFIIYLIFKGDFSSRALAAHLQTAEKDFDDKTPKGASWRDIEFSYNDPSVRLAPYEGKRRGKDFTGEDDEADSPPARSPKREHKSRYVEEEEEESEEERPVVSRRGTARVTSPRQREDDEDEEESSAAAGRPQRRDRFQHRIQCVSE